jgi:tetratricopeptide (TPR) repeat protein
LTSKQLNHDGIALFQSSRISEALCKFNAAISIEPDNPNYRFNRGLVYRQSGDLERAIDDYTKALQLDENHYQALFNRGFAYREMHHFEKALEDFQKASKFPAIRDCSIFNQSLLWLLAGDFDRGWPAYESRWACSQLKLNKRTFNKPLWLGKESLKGATVLLHSEQGLGDTIQFCRYAVELLRHDCKIVLEVQPQLFNLIDRNNKGIHVISEGEPLLNFDFHCPLMSLPLALGTTIKTIPNPGKYLSAEPITKERWRHELGQKTKPRVAIVWSGNRNHINNNNRSIRLKDIARAFDQKINWFSLQQEITPDERAILKSLNNVRHLGDNIHNFEDTAAICDLMDAVVSVDTATAHLAGALSKPTILLLPFVPDFRWLSKGHKTPWYSSLKIYRQSADRKWTDLVSLATNELAQALTNKLIG